MNRRARNALVAIGLAAAGSSLFWAPPVLRKVDWFGADRVEVTGAHLLAPHEVLRAGGIGIGANVWTDPAAWEAALRRHPVIARAEVKRHLPRTLSVRIVEKTPAAFVEAGTLRPATADGEILPVDPARGAIDLPLLAARVKPDANSRVADPSARAALAETARLAGLEPALMARVSEVRPGMGGEMRLVLSRSAVDVLVRAGMDETALVRLRAALDDVSRRIASDTARTGRTEIDARFEDQVVVRAKR